MGGLRQRARMQYSSFPGGQVRRARSRSQQTDGTARGQVLSTPILWQATPGYSNANCSASSWCPAPMATSGGIRMAVQQVYPGQGVVSDSTAPAEFVFFPSTYRLFNTHRYAAAPENAWLDAAVLLRTPPSSSSSMSATTIGIAVGVAVAGLVVLAVVVVLCVRQRRRAFAEATYATSVGSTDNVAMAPARGTH